VIPTIYSLFVLGAVLTCILTPLIRHFALRKGFVDCPHRARKVHKQATPRLGGAAVLASYTLVLLIGGLFVPQLKEMLWGENGFGGYILVGALVIFVIGVLDDLSRLSPKTKLMGEFMVAAFVVWGAKFSFSEVQLLGLGTISFPEWFGFGLACLWIVGMTNAINLIDGLDGLASGITLAGLLAISVVGYLGGISSVTWMSTMLIGCLLGFLVYNSRPASIFLGDCGSLTLGYLAGCLSLVASFREGGVLDGIFPVLAFAVPILDCFFAIFRRLMRGRSPFSPDMEHFHHRLMAKGLSHGKAVLAMWAASFSCSVVAIAAAFGQGDQLLAIFVFFGMGGFILLRYLGYFRFEFFGQSLSNLIEDRRTTRTAEQSVKDAELMLNESIEFENLQKVLGKAAEGMQFHEAIISFYEEDGRLGTKIDSGNNNVGKKISWRDPEYSGFYSRDNEFVAEFPISGRQFAYGNILYRFVDNRKKLEVHEEILLERIHDALSLFAAKVRKQSEV
jgi:UDP-GlcNAc:undecaprenyl-phosphate GlcNAc-1-phosphate transferase